MTRLLVGHGPRLRFAGAEQGFVLLAVLLAVAVVVAVAALLNIGAPEGTPAIRTQLASSQARFAAEAGLNHATWLAQRSNCQPIPPATRPLAMTSYSYSVTATGAGFAKVTATGSLADGTSAAGTRRDVPMLFPPTTTELRPGPEGEDTYIDNGARDMNWGSSPTMRLSANTSREKRGLLRFKLDAIPIGATVTSAELTLTLAGIGSGNSGNVKLQRVMTYWTEAAASWTQASPEAPWSTPGGDAAGSTVANVAVDYRYPGPTRFDLTALVQSWVRGTIPNYGVLLSAGSDLNDVDFVASDGADASQHPVLTVTWSCQCGGICLFDAPSCPTDYIPNQQLLQVPTAGFGSNRTDGVTYLPFGVTLRGVPAPKSGAWVTVDSTTDRLYMVSLQGTLLHSLAAPTATASGVTLVQGGLRTNTLAVTDVAERRVSFVPLDASGTGSSFNTNGDGVSSPVGITFVGQTASGALNGMLAVADQATERVFLYSQSGKFSSSFSVSNGQPSLLQDVVHIPGSDKLLVAFDDEVVTFDLSGALLARYPVAGFGASGIRGIAINTSNCRHLIADEPTQTLKTLRRVEPCNANFGAVQRDESWRYGSGPGTDSMRGISFVPEGFAFGGATVPEGGGFVAVDALSPRLRLYDKHGQLLDESVNAPSQELTGVTLVTAGTRAGYLATVQKGAASQMLHYVHPTGGGLPASLDISTMTRTPADVTFVERAASSAYDNHLVLVDDSFLYVINQAGTLISKHKVVEVVGAATGVVHLPGSNRVLVVNSAARTASTFNLVSGVKSSEYSLDSLGLDSAQAVTVDAEACRHVVANDFTGGGSGTDEVVYLRKDPSAGSGPACDGVFLDSLNKKAYDNSDGTLDWRSSPWEEIGEGDGATSGDLQVRVDGGANRIRLRNYRPGGLGLKRAADLAGADSATLSFLYRRAAVDDANDYVTVEVSGNGAVGPWTELARIAGPQKDSSPQSLTVDVTKYASVSTQIRLMTSPGLSTGDSIYFDDVALSCTP